MRLMMKFLVLGTTVAVLAFGAFVVTALTGGAKSEALPAAPAAFCPPGPSDVKRDALIGDRALTVPPDDSAESSLSAGSDADMPYPLPTTTGKTGREEPVNTAGQVPSTGKKVTFSQHAQLGAAYRDYYITMLWTYAAWDFNGHARGIDEEQFSWFAERPRLVLVTNPRTGKSIIAAAIEAGPGPWVGFGGDRNPAAHHWNGFERGTPEGFDGIVSGFPPPALAALDARTGYATEDGDELIYAWAPDQNAVPGPTTLTATTDGIRGTATPTDDRACAPDADKGAKTAKYQAPTSGVEVTIPASEYSTYNGINYAGKVIKAPNAEVAKGIAAGLAYLGAPYVWGGGGPKGPDDGCIRLPGGGKNACQGIVGFDCSGLTMYVLAVSGYSIPGNSAAQRSGPAQQVGWDKALPGDIIGYPGHVSIYLGEIDGQRLQLEAPDVGMNVRITTLFRNDSDPALYRYWK